MLREFGALLLLLAVHIDAFIIEKNLELEYHNFAFLTSFCGKPTGAVLKYTIDFPLDNCCPSLLSYFEKQWWEIWPDPHKNCTEKQSVLRTDWAQIQELRVENSLAGCSINFVNSTNITTAHVLCRGERVYEVDSYDPSKAKCWFIAANNCNSRGLKMKYTFNITGAYYNNAERATPALQNILAIILVAVLQYIM